MNILPVTFVKFIPCSDRLVSASGSDLYLIDCSNKSIIDSLSLEHIQIIHGFKLKRNVLVVFGGHSFCVCFLNDNIDKFEYANEFVRHNDFILDCLIFDETEKSVGLCVALAHGPVYFYRLETKGVCNGRLRVEGASFPTDMSLLYCCHLFTNEAVSHPNKVFLSGGSVHNVIMIWQMSASGECDCLSRLAGGHKGAIFGVNVAWCDGVMISVGDDRAVAMWVAIGGLSEDENTLEGVQWRMTRRFLGHEARVWGGLQVPDTGLVVAWGEDCSVRLWRINGSVCGSLTPHCGRSVWTADIRTLSDRLLIVTGGNDGAVVLSEFSLNEDQHSTVSLTISDRQDFPRRVALLPTGQILVVTDLGQVYTDCGGQLTRVDCDGIDESILASYCCCQCSWDTDSGQDGLVLLGNMHGCFISARVVTTDGMVTRLVALQTMQVGHKIMMIGEGLGPVGSALSLSNGQLISLTRTDNGQFCIEEVDICLKNGWASCWTSWWADEVQNVVCGDRDGRLHLFSIVGRENKQSSRAAVLSRSINMTKKGGITSVLWDTESECLFVGNKLGEVWSMNGQLEQRAEVLKNPAVMGWVSRIELCCDDGAERGLTVTGFRSSMFRRVAVRCDGTQPVIVLEQECGGGHRDWDYLHRLPPACRQLVFIQTRAVSSVSWGSQHNQPLVLKPHLHGKEINFSMFLVNDEDKMLIVTGSEDCSLAVATLSRERADVSSPKLERIRRLHGHISSVRCVAKLGPSLLVSAGGRGQIVFWRRSQPASDSISIVATALLPRLLGSVTDVRIMDICYVDTVGDADDDHSLTALACSDGSLMFLSLASNSNRPKLESQCRLSSSCLTGVVYHRSVIVSSSTDGKIYWMPVFGRRGGTVQCHQMCQCAVQGIDIASSVDETRISIIAGGDDGSVLLAQLWRHGTEWSVSESCQSSLAHSGGTVATRWLAGDRLERLVSLGGDGRLLLWSTAASAGSQATKLSLILCLASRAGVTDPHSLSVVQDPFKASQYWLLIAGMGARLLSFGLDCDQ